MPTINPKAYFVFSAAAIDRINYLKGRYKDLEPEGASAVYVGWDDTPNKGADRLQDRVIIGFYSSSELRARGYETQKVGEYDIVFAVRAETAFLFNGKSIDYKPDRDMFVLV